MPSDIDITHTNDQLAVATSGLSSLQVNDSSDAGTVPGEGGKSTKVIKPSKFKSKLRSQKALQAAPDASSATPDSVGSPNSNLELITATSQQSRFYRETFDASSTDIDIKGVNISIGTRELLVDAHLRLKEGVKYGMVGQNGVGKSVLMSALGNNILVGLPQNVRILHIAQLEEPTPGRTILEEVLSADTDRTRIISEARALHDYNSKSSSTSDAQLNIIIHSLLISRAQASLALAQKIALKRSGQRGHTARQALLSTEAHLAFLQEQDPQEYITPQMAANIMEEVFGRYASGELDVEGDEVRARGILKGLGFKEEEIGEKVGESGVEVRKLSGGWRMRVVLAKALFIKPDILLLDEPTNHLDLPSILWLQSYLLSSLTTQQTIVVVSHDRNFLDSVTSETIIFRDKKLLYHPGNYADYEKNTEEQRKRKMRLKELDEKRKKAIKESIARGVAMARGGDEKKLGMVASRKKKLERMGMQRLEDGKRFKESYHGFRSEIVVEQTVKIMPIRLPPPEPFNFPGSSFLQLSDVSFQYVPKQKSPMILNNISLDVGPNARIGLLGPNGCGKSTLMNVLAGELVPTRGEVKKHHRLRIGYFSQHIVDMLDLGVTPLQALFRAYSPPESTSSSGISSGAGLGLGGGQGYISSQPLTEATLRSHFALLGLPANALTQPIGTLSGGQRNRVALALITFHQPHVLLLDEITNHLDWGSVESLVEALREWEGACVVVSHDVWFLRGVVEGGSGSDGDDEDYGPGKRGGGQGDGDGEEEEGVLYQVTKKGELKRWEKGLEAYVERVQKLANKAVVGT